jgi:hypothetical protein
MTPAFVARDGPVGDSDQNRTLSIGLQVLVKGSSRKRGMFPPLTPPDLREETLNPLRLLMWLTTRHPTSHFLKRATIHLHEYPKNLTIYR